MPTYVCLLRGINVGGHKKIRMAELRELCQAAGLVDVETHIQSGNLVFDSADADASSVATFVAREIESRFGFTVPTIIRRGGDIHGVIRDNPFAGRESVDQAKLHVAFLSNSPSPSGLERLASLHVAPDEFAAAGPHLYLHCPDGCGRSKLTNPVLERHLEVVATTRNWRTINALYEMVSNR